MQEAQREVFDLKTKKTQSTYNLMARNKQMSKDMKNGPIWNVLTVISQENCKASKEQKTIH